jgi:hypothetical protein
VVRRRGGQSLGSNPWLVAAVAGSLALHGRLPYTPLAGVFDVDPLGGADWPRVAAAVAVVVDNRLLLGRRD